MASPQFAQGYSGSQTWDVTLQIRISYFQKLVTYEGESTMKVNLHNMIIPASCRGLALVTFRGLI